MPRKVELTLVDEPQTGPVKIELCPDTVLSGQAYSFFKTNINETTTIGAMLVILDAAQKMTRVSE